MKGRRTLYAAMKTKWSLSVTYYVHSVPITKELGCFSSNILPSLWVTGAYLGLLDLDYRLLSSLSVAQYVFVSDVVKTDCFANSLLSTVLITPLSLILIFPVVQIVFSKTRNKSAEKLKCLQFKNSTIWLYSAFNFKKTTWITVPLSQLCFDNH